MTTRVPESASVGGAVPDPAAPKKSRAGRNLPAALAVGLSLGAALVLTLYTYRPLFVIFVSGTIGIAVHELVVAVRRTGIRPPMIPLVVGGITTAAIGYPFGTDAAIVAALGTIAVASVWRLVAPPADGSATVAVDLAASAFITLYVGFLAAFCVLLAGPSDGPRRVTAMIVTAVCSDVGGYAAGVLSGGKHKLAPTISPGKSVEGLIGGTVVCIISGLVFFGPVLHSHWWAGVIFGLALVVTATGGDLVESSIKRDIGIKDMGNLLPGHGGILDRIDSLLLSAPVAWILLSALVTVR